MKFAGFTLPNTKDIADEVKEELGLIDQHLPTNSIQVIKTDTGEIELCHQVSEHLCFKKVIDKSLFKEKTKYAIFSSKLYGIMIMDDIAYNRSVSQPSLLQSKFKTGLNPIANIFFNSSYDDSCLIIMLPAIICDIEDAEWDFIKSPCCVHGYYAKLYPDAKDILLTKIESKLNMNLEVDLTDSVVALEQQVDLLTTLVKALLNSETPPSWANDFINKIETNNVLKTRSDAEEIIKDMADYKASMRTRQEQYFEERSGKKEPTFKNETTSK
tara:strand:+ start:131 stop:943 length:813 start_codon:yes stop_codon:yes gene_type:complete